MMGRSRAEDELFRRRYGLPPLGGMPGRMPMPGGPPEATPPPAPDATAPDAAGTPPPDGAPPADPGVVDPTAAPKSKKKGETNELAVATLTFRGVNLTTVDAAANTDIAAAGRKGLQHPVAGTEIAKPGNAQISRIALEPVTPRRVEYLIQPRNIVEIVDAKCPCGSEPEIAGGGIKR